MENTDQHFNAILNNYLKDFDQIPISKEQRAMLPIIAFTVQGISEQVKAYVQAAVDQGVNSEKILGVIYQLEPVVGLGKVQAALAVVHQVIPANHQMQHQDDPQFGKDVQARIYGTEIRNLLADLPDGAGDFVADHLTNHFFGDFYQHEVLTVAERELYELMALITLNVDFQIKGCLKAGNSESLIIWTIINMLPYIGFPLVINSIQKVHAAAQELQD
ncbi:MAG TPA: carboxymuconolactone decarboxylase family protein [Candidatus Ligilactobacillus faecavium]|nr:carboxymuconolactone decarboxylase family protein [Candidatus Ligilactobacillus faecavium]